MSIALFTANKHITPNTSESTTLIAQAIQRRWRPILSHFWWASKLVSQLIIDRK